MAAHDRLLLIGLIPLAALGILFGHLLTVDSIGPAIGGLTAILAFVSGTWFPLGHGLLDSIAQCLPSYWLVQASHVALGAGGWPAKGWIVGRRLERRRVAARRLGVPPRHAASVSADRRLAPGAASRGTRERRRFASMRP